MSRELPLKRELLMMPGILKSNSGSHLTKYFLCNRLSIIGWLVVVVGGVFFFLIRLFLCLQSVFFCHLLLLCSVKL